MKRSASKLVARDPREVQREADMAKALSGFAGKTSGNSARGPAARGVRRSVFS